MIISVHLGPPHPGLCSCNDNVLRALTSDILVEVFIQIFIINYRNHWQNVKIIIFVHLGPPHPGLCSFNANVLRDLTSDILGDVFVETFIINFRKLWFPRITERVVQWIVYILFPPMTMFWGLGRPLKKMFNRWLQSKGVAIHQMFCCTVTVYSLLLKATFMSWFLLDHYFGPLGLILCQKGPLYLKEILEAIAGIPK